MAQEKIIPVAFKVRLKTQVIILLAIVAASIPVAEAAARTYSTNFSLIENPISEGGNWINGKTAGLDWANVSTTQGIAIGLQSGSIKYDDATALLTGAWGPDQTVTATVYTVNQNSDIFEEVELRLRSSLSAHSSTGYEVLFSCRNDAKAYVQIVRWNGPLGSFTHLNGKGGVGVGISNGDIVKATIIGTVITAYINNVQVLQATDTTYATGSPGMGFYLEGATGLNGNYGFTSFTASDSATSSKKIPKPPEDLRVMPTP
jgi:hypothetical protein